jgi:hypothetical protein
MTLVPLRDQMQAADSLLDLATRLGRICLDHGGQLLATAANEDVRPISKALEAKVAAMDPEQWLRAAESGCLVDMLDVDRLGKLVSIAEIHHPIEYMAVLRGLCQRALPRFYNGIEGRLLLDRGVPVALVSRPINRLFRATPNPSTTLSVGHPLAMLGYKLFEYSSGGSTRIELDFACRERLDEITWTGEQRLPRIATVHPFLGAQGIEIGHETRTWFFDVRPKEWDVDTMLGHLRKVGSIPIAVLPELCLPIADALEHALAADPASYPPLVVAGSAHIRESGVAEVRANESRIYLDGQRVAVHRKIHPFRTKHLGGHSLPYARTEGLTSEVKTITVLSGEHTRLAVSLCADLNDEQIPLLLEGACVNLLLVPAMTGGEGAFNGAVCALASRCQAVAVIVNAGLDPRPEIDDDSAPFLVLAAVPRPGPEEQSRRYRNGSERRAYLSIVDPNAQLDAAVTWVDG